jgi:hypothetical protein
VRENNYFGRLRFEQPFLLFDNFTNELADLCCDPKKEPLQTNVFELQEIYGGKILIFFSACSGEENIPKNFINCNVRNKLDLKVFRSQLTTAVLKNR